MKFLSGFTQLTKITRMFSSNANKPTVPQPIGIVYIRYAARLLILGLALFILLWWPAKSFQPESFNDWSQKMTDLPNNVWYLILSVILSWGVTEVMSAKSANSYIPPDINQLSDGGGETSDASGDELDGRFSNINNSDEFLTVPTEPNPVIEAWRNETK